MTGGRCSAHVLAAGVLYGCPDPAAGDTPTNVQGWTRAVARVALCAEHLALVESGGALTITLDLGPAHPSCQACAAARSLGCGCGTHYPDGATNLRLVPGDGDQG